jgi:hypothetical protein
LVWISSFGRKSNMMISDCRLLLSVTLIFAILGARNSDLPNGGRPQNYDDGVQGDDKTHDVVGEEHEMQQRGRD